MVWYCARHSIRGMLLNISLIRPILFLVLEFMMFHFHSVGFHEVDLIRDRKILRKQFGVNYLPYDMVRYITRLSAT
jgi:hypothetical protein